MYVPLTLELRNTQLCRHCVFSYYEGLSQLIQLSPETSFAGWPAECLLFGVGAEVSYVQFRRQTFDQLSN
jgi:hypothetical protein